MPEKALTVTPLAKKECFAKPENDNSVTEKSQNVSELNTSEQTYLINKNKTLKVQSELGKPPQKSNLNEDKVLDLSTGFRQKFPENKKSTLPQNSDGGWDFLGKLSKFFY